MTRPVQTPRGVLQDDAASRVRAPGTSHQEDVALALAESFESEIRAQVEAALSAARRRAAPPDDLGGVA